MILLLLSNYSINYSIIYFSTYLIDYSSFYNYLFISIKEGLKSNSRLLITINIIINLLFYNIERFTYFILSNSYSYSY